MRLAYLAGAALLAGCNSLPEKVRIPVPVACIDAKDIPTRPPLVADRDLRATGASNGTRWIGAKNYQDLAEPYISDLELIARGCSKIK